MTQWAPSSMPEPWDRGLQSERTTLAWVRTLLSLLIADVALARLTADRSAFLAILMLAIPMPMTLHLLNALGSRGTRIERQLRDSLPLRDAWKFTSTLTWAVVAIAPLELMTLFVT